MKQLPYSVASKIYFKVDNISKDVYNDATVIYMCNVLYSPEVMAAVEKRIAKIISVRLVIKYTKCTRRNVIVICVKTSN